MVQHGIKGKKNEKAEAGVYRRRTGGGRQSRALSPITERVAELFGDSPPLMGLLEWRLHLLMMVKHLN